MAKGYWIARVKVHDPQAYKRYVEATTAALEKFGARPIVRGGRHETKEGEDRPRNVVWEFPDYETALACYDSPEYAAAREIRLAAADAELVVVEGHEAS
jgi:uncharacterized protein (DUF1330 family)